MNKFFKYFIVSIIIEILILVGMAWYQNDNQKPTDDLQDSSAAASSVDQAQTSLKRNKKNRDQTMQDTEQQAYQLTKNFEIPVSYLYQPMPQNYIPSLSMNKPSLMPDKSLLLDQVSELPPVSGKIKPLYDFGLQNAESFNPYESIHDSFMSNLTPEHSVVPSKSNLHGSDKSVSSKSYGTVANNAIKPSSGFMQSAPVASNQKQGYGFAKPSNQELDQSVRNDFKNKKPQQLQNQNQGLPQVNGVQAAKNNIAINQPQGIQPVIAKNISGPDQNAEEDEADENEDGQDIVVQVPQPEVFPQNVAIMPGPEVQPHGQNNLGDDGVSIQPHPIPKLYVNPQGVLPAVPDANDVVQPKAMPKNIIHVASQPHDLQINTQQPEIDQKLTIDNVKQELVEDEHQEHVQEEDEQIPEEIISEELLVTGNDDDSDTEFFDIDSDDVQEPDFNDVQVKIPSLDENEDEDILLPLGVAVGAGLAPFAQRSDQPQGGPSAKAFDLQMLGFGADANPDEQEIKKKYREMVGKIHPDVNPNDDQAAKKMKQINDAKQRLLDPFERKKREEREQKEQEERLRQARVDLDAVYQEAAHVVELLQAEEENKKLQILLQQASARGALLTKQELEKELRALQGQVMQRDQALQNLENTMKDVQNLQQKNIRDLVDQVEKEKNRNAKIAQAIEEQGFAINQKNQELKFIKHEKELLNNQLQSLEDRINQLHKQNINLQREAVAKAEQWQNERLFLEQERIKDTQKVETRLNQQLQNYEQEKLMLQKQINDMHDQLRKNKQLSDDAKQNFNNQIQDSQNKILVLEQQIAQERNNVQSKMYDLENTINHERKEIFAKMHNLEQSERKLKNQRKQDRAQLKELEEKLAHQKIVAQEAEQAIIHRNKTVKRKNKELQKVRQVRNQLQEQLQTLNYQMNEMENKTQSLQQGAMAKAEQWREERSRLEQERLQERLETEKNVMEYVQYHQQEQERLQKQIEQMQEIAQDAEEIAQNNWAAKVQPKAESIIELQFGPIPKLNEPVQDLASELFDLSSIQKDIAKDMQEIQEHKAQLKMLNQTMDQKEQELTLMVDNAAKQQRKRIKALAKKEVLPKKAKAVPIENIPQFNVESKADIAQKAFEITGVSKAPESKKVGGKSKQGSSMKSMWKKSAEEAEIDRYAKAIGLLMQPPPVVTQEQQDQMTAERERLLLQQLEYQNMLEQQKKQQNMQASVENIGMQSVGKVSLEHQTSGLEMGLPSVPGETGSLSVLAENIGKLRIRR